MTSSAGRGQGWVAWVRRSRRHHKPSPRPGRDMSAGRRPGARGRRRRSEHAPSRRRPDTPASRNHRAVRRPREASSTPRRTANPTRGTPAPSEPTAATEKAGPRSETSHTRHRAAPTRPSCRASTVCPELRARHAQGPFPASRQTPNTPRAAQARRSSSTRSGGTTVPADWCREAHQVSPERLAASVLAVRSAERPPDPPPSP